MYNVLLIVTLQSEITPASSKIEIVISAPLSAFFFFFFFFLIVYLTPLCSVVVVSISVVKGALKEEMLFQSPGTGVVSVGILL
jgi:hypothetical protein